MYKNTEVEKECVKPIEIIRGKLNIGVRGENFEVLFSELNGGLASYRYAGKEMIKAIPKPNFCNVVHCSSPQVKGFFGLDSVFTVGFRTR